jgi:hypothetical protein
MDVSSHFHVPATLTPRKEPAVSIEYGSNIIKGYGTGGAELCRINIGRSAYKIFGDRRNKMLILCHSWTSVTAYYGVRIVQSVCRQSGRPGLDSRK